MTTLTEKLDLLEDQLASQNTLIAGYIDTVESKLQLVNDNLSIIEENMAVNTKALLAALGQTGACFPCPTPSIVVPPIATNPTAPSTENCKRSQGIIATIHAILEGMDTLQSFNVIGSFNVINDAISEIIGSISAGDTLPLPSFPEAVNIVGDYVSYAGERVFSGVGLIDQFSTLEPTILSAIAGASDPSVAQSQYNGVIDASGASNGAKLLFKAVAYNALWSYYYDPASTPDLSGFDGSICSIETCFVLTAVETHFPGDTRYAIDWDGAKPCVNITDTGYTSDHCSWNTENMAGWTATSDDGDLYIFYDFHSSRIDTGSGSWSHTFGATTALFIGRLSGSGPFTIEFCPPS
jgi:hypothetical protein